MAARKGEGCCYAVQPHRDGKKIAPAVWIAEQKCWDLLRGSKIDGHKFRRQHPVGRYITDFACERLRLVLEIDGGIHSHDDVALNDHFRQAELEAMGWTVLRFSNQQVLDNTETLANAIRAHARLIDI